MTFPIVMDEGQAVTYVSGLGISPFPMDVVIDRDGIIRYIRREYDPDPPPRCGARRALGGRYALGSAGAVAPAHAGMAKRVGGWGDRGMGSMPIAPAAKRFGGSMESRR